MKNQTQIQYSKKRYNELRNKIAVPAKRINTLDYTISEFEELCHLHHIKYYSARRDIIFTPVFYRQINIFNQLILDFYSTILSYYLAKKGDEINEFQRINIRDTPLRLKCLVWAMACSILSIEDQISHTNNKDLVQTHNLMRSYWDEANNAYSIFKESPKKLQQCFDFENATPIIETYLYSRKRNPPLINPFTDFLKKE